jgi:hypothetical protein
MPLVINLLVCTLSASSSKVSTCKRQTANKFVSTTKAPSLDCLNWIPQGDKKVRNSKVWDFMGQLTVGDGDSGRHCPIDDRLYCKFCLEDQKVDAKGHMSKIYSSQKSTGSGNHLAHATSKHGKDYSDDRPQPKLTTWLKKAVEHAPAMSEYEFNRDLALYMCCDLVPFHAVEKQGFKNFCTKNMPFELPTADTVGKTALVDVYSVVRQKVIAILSECFSCTIMMDGWTDRYKANPYFAIRVSFVHNWQFQVITLSIQPVESHTSASLMKVVRKFVAEFLPHYNQVLFFNTTDGASNMKLLSTLLGHERIDCSAHCLHLLLTVDGLAKVPELVSLMKRCKEIVTTLHFKGHVVTESVNIANDMAMFEKIQNVVKILSCDEANPVADEPDDSEVGESATSCDPNAQHSGHQTLKITVVTRWNSILTMVESILDLYDPMNEALRKLGKFDLCLDDDDRGVLREMRVFLTAFKSMTLLVSACNPNLSLLPLLRTHIMKACEPRRDDNNRPIDSSAISRLKKHVRTSVDKRIKINTLVKLSSCFDPAVRNAVLSSDECRQLLNDAFKVLTRQGGLDSEYDSDSECQDIRPSPVRHMFEQNTPAPASEGPAVQADECHGDHGDDIKDDDANSEIAVKKLRLALLHVGLL